MSYLVQQPTSFPFIEPAQYFKDSSQISLTKLCDLLCKKLHSLRGVAEDDALKDILDKNTFWRTEHDIYLTNESHHKSAEKSLVSFAEPDFSGEYRKGTHHKRNLSRQTRLVNQVRPFVGHHYV